MPTWRDDPAAVRPMLATLADPPPAGPGLVYEPKYDGMRVLVDARPPARRGEAPHVALYSRNGREKTAQFPALRDALARLARRLPGPVLADGEVVAIDRRGRPLGFQRLQGRIHLTAAADIAEADRRQPVALVLFDLLRDADEDLRGEPLVARRLRLQARVPGRARTGPIRLSELAAEDGRPLLDRARREGWEGLLVKDARSRYHSGRRSPAWRKLKLTAEQEFLVGGWTDPRQSRRHFGALLVGYRDGRRLRYAGSVGTGFDEAGLAQVAALLARRKTAVCPFADPGRVPAGHWVRPDLVVAVRFTEWTGDGLLRQPVYLGLRDDKPASAVRLERPAPPAVGGGAPSPKAADRGLDAVLGRLEALEDARRDGEVALPNGDTLRVTNLWKVFWPGPGLTKGDLLRYYVTVSPLLLPAVADRPLVMKRFPNGIDKPAFYQQKHPEAVPAGVRREVLDEDPGEDAERGLARLVGGSLTTLLYMAQLAAISQDPWFSRAGSPLEQDYAAIDLDPGEGASFGTVLDVARRVRDELERLGVPAVPKTSGSRGLHIYVPLPRGTSYDTGQLLCHVVASLVSQRAPKVATIERMVRRRPRGTVYVDYLQNIAGKTLATAYSARASDYAGVSTPLTWDEVDRGIDPRDFTMRTAPARFREAGDLWARLRRGRPVNLRAVLRKVT